AKQHRFTFYRPPLNIHAIAITADLKAKHAQSKGLVQHLGVGRVARTLPPRAHRAHVRIAQNQAAKAVSSKHRFPGFRQACPNPEAARHYSRRALQLVLVRLSLIWARLPSSGTSAVAISFSRRGFFPRFRDFIPVFSKSVKAV